MSRKEFEPSPAQRQLVELHTAIGTPQEVLAKIIGIDAKTLRKHFREELDTAQAKANAAIGGSLFNKAKGGDTAAMIFWMKTRAGWRETGPDQTGDEEAQSMTVTIKSIPAVADIRVTRTDG